MPKRTTHRHRGAAAELLDLVAFDSDGRLEYVDSHVGTDAQRVALAHLLLASADDQERVAEALEAMEELLDGLEPELD